MKFFKKTTALVLSAITALSFTSCSTSYDPLTSTSDKTTTEIVSEMGVGINLGNTFESSGSWISGGSVSNYETAWGSPIITEEMIKGYAEAGFGVLRIPVAWSNMMDAEYNIDQTYIDRVKEVTEWTLEAGMYAIVNIHWDGGWWEDFPTKKDECMKKYEKIWTQLCDAFGEYGEHLMFESLNEEGGWSSMWNRYGASTDGKADSYALLNEINQKFVDIVRGSGKNNAKRHLLIAGYNTDVQLTCDELFKMPSDTENRCAVSMHYYTPSTFCILEKDASWGKARDTWGTDEDIAELNANMELIQKAFLDKGIPVIIGEYGCSTGNKTEDMVIKFISTVCNEIYSRGMCPVLWDVTNAFYSRSECKMKDPALQSAIMEVKNK